MTDVYTAIGNKVRAKLLLCLFHKSKNVTELIQICGLAQSAVSQHLAKLKKAGLVRAKKVGQEVYYSLTSPKAAEVSRALQSLEEEVL